MNSSVVKNTGRLLLVILAAAFTVAHFPGRASCEEMTIDINPSPYIINLWGDMYSFVIHTNISYARVADPAEVTVNEEPIFAWKRDSLGYFDAIVLVDAIGLVAGGYNLLELEGETDDGGSFYGAEELLVIDRAEGPGKIFK